MSQKKKKHASRDTFPRPENKDDDTRDPHNRHNVHPNPGGGGNPPSDPYPPLQAPPGGGDINQGFLLAAATSVIDLHSPSNANADTNEEDNDAEASSYWTTARNPLLAI